VLCCAAMPKKLKVAVVGPGRLGSALATVLHQNGYPIQEIVSRKQSDSLRRAATLARAVNAEVRPAGTPLAADVIWICVPDAEIASCAKSLGNLQSWTRKTVFHSSGALSSDQLAEFAEAGAAVASVHPMMSFVRGVTPKLEGVTFAVEGDRAAVRVARQIVRDLGANFLSINKEDKTLYHAWGAFASPLIVAELAAAERIAEAIGITSKQARKTLAPMLRQTIENYIELGAANAFSGPIVRGDVDTVRRHLLALKKIPQARQVYLALARAAVKDLVPANRRVWKTVLAG
jgi:predicted short-subunit dehydrogenase-like oxidoreductase (DUF2520 family)